MARVRGEAGKADHLIVSAQIRTDGPVHGARRTASPRGRLGMLVPAASRAHRRPIRAWKKVGFPCMMGGVKN
jgi:hypothetical protein